MDAIVTELLSAAFGRVTARYVTSVCKLTNSRAYEHRLRAGSSSIIIVTIIRVWRQKAISKNQCVQVKEGTPANNHTLNTGALPTGEGSHGGNTVSRYTRPFFPRNLIAQQLVGGSNKPTTSLSTTSTSPDQPTTTTTTTTTTPAQRIPPGPVSMAIGGPAVASRLAALPTHLMHSSLVRGVGVLGYLRSPYYS
ncbi:hypothetical protein PAAG_11984 [Paracoccidioides lutzii Pb01]|uniref:Uncharacterized protein n=1 Tax=Paracoccidioides lutzii (strain ATCC MYA-826 / Pb01) TaxID=502779 RepID=A0A0A2V4M3_PARBA|nr:hypothetical protein PAAG_11984 [Paracoccidioides lutzii Pb01]KGQ01307.1 hypothetical protein PAAG_11984 [Paracoccidioides lutzii Pb01]